MSYDDIPEKELYKMKGMIMKFDVSLDIVYNDKTTIQKIKSILEKQKGVETVIIFREPRALNTQMRR